jgi:hypothetical protein
MKIRNKIDQIESAKLESNLFPTQLKSSPKHGAKNAPKIALKSTSKTARPSILSQMPRVAEVDGRDAPAVFGGKKIPPSVARYAAAYRAAEKKQQEMYQAHRKLWLKQQQVCLVFVCMCVCVCVCV